VPAPAAIKDKADGYSVFGDWTFMPQWALFARYDRVDYKYSGVNGIYKQLKDTYYNAGVSYDVMKNLRLALAWKYDKLEGPVGQPVHLQDQRNRLLGHLELLSLTVIEGSSIPGMEKRRALARRLLCCIPMSQLRASRCGWIHPGVKSSF
jgi:Outer membrane protein (porin)